MSSSLSSSSFPSTASAAAALLQFYVGEDKLDNIKTATEFVANAVSHPSLPKLIVLPEIWNSPYSTSAFRSYSEPLPAVGASSCDPAVSPSVDCLIKLAFHHKVHIVGGSIPEIHDDKIYNTCLVLDATGTVIAKHRKIHLFDIDVPGGVKFKESDTLTAGDEITTFDLPPPFGKTGLGICYDIRFPELALIMRQKKCRTIIFPGAFNLTTGPPHWELLQRARAVDSQSYVLTASPARITEEMLKAESKYPKYSAWGHSTAVNPWGEVIGKLDEKPGICVVEMDMNKVDEMRRNIPTIDQKRGDLYSVKSLTDV